MSITCDAMPLLKYCTLYPKENIALQFRISSDLRFIIVEQLQSHQDMLCISIILAEMNLMIKMTVSALVHIDAVKQNDAEWRKQHSKENWLAMVTTTNY